MLTSSHISRRDLLKYGAASGLTFMLAACAPPSGNGQAATSGSSAASGQASPGSSAASPAASGQAASSGRASGNAGEKVLVVATDSEPDNLDPPESTSIADGRVTLNMFEALVTYAPDSFKLNPLLAESWQVSSDAKTYTFKLHKGIKFQDGTNFTAESVKFNIDRQLDKQNAYHNTGPFPLAAARLGGIASVEAAGDSTLRFNLKAPSTVFLDNLTLNAPSEFESPDAIKKWGKTVGQHPTGTGPYMLDQWEKGKQVVLKANPAYWGERPANAPSKIIFVTFPEGQARLAALQSGQADIIYSVPPDYVQQIQRNPDLELVKFNTSQVWFVQMDTRHPPFDKVEVRQALNYAVNKDDILKALNGTAVRAYGPLPVTIPGAAPDQVRHYDYDVAKAKQLLSQAGYPKGFDVTLAIPQSGPGQQDPPRMAAVIQSNLAGVGVNVKIESYEWGTFETKRIAGAFPFATRGWTSALGNADSTLYQNFDSHMFPKAGRNTTYYHNPQVDSWLEQAQRELNAQKQAQLYLEVQKQVVEDAPWIFVDHEVGYVAYRKATVAKFVPHPSEIHRLAYVQMK